jgi:peptidoglycan/xylan/chitin deacetylase (PgdA/CDA1 family)
MISYLITTPFWLRIFYPNRIWSVPRTTIKTLYLTFDDGPHPTITALVLDLLKKYNAKGTFFCIGKNVAAYPDTYQQILAEGHRAGNHTHNHLNGWKTSAKDYLKNIQLADNYIYSPLFRPPYGKMTGKQAKQFMNYSSFDTPSQIVMWSLLSGDFDTNISGEQCMKNILKNAKDGDIIVFHDSEKAAGRLQVALPKTLEYFSGKGFTFSALPL